MGLASFRYADTLLIYSPLKYEIDVNELIDAALASGKRVAFPRCHPEDCTMSFHYVCSRDQLEKTDMGILEPPLELPIYDPATHTGRAICIIPGVTYDTHGYRIGYGKGYYDRFLREFRGTRVGVTYHRLLTDRLPRGKFDLPADAVITERGVRAFYEN